MKNFISFPDEALNYSIFDRFTEIARKFPDKCAIKSGSTSTTYKQLLESSYPIATEICSAVWPNTPIALLLPQGPQFISGMLGCLAAGTPYVPLDINYPVERLRLMLEVAKPALIITNKDGEEFAKSICGKDCKVLTTETLRVAFALTPRANSKSHAYLLFTSGSTGKPKGVLECHQNILHNVLRQTNSFFITADDHQSLLYTCGVYGGARDIFSAILNGATLFHYDIEAEGYEKIGSWMRESQISIYCSVATIYRYLTQYISNPTDVASVRIVKLGGEASRKSDIETFQKLFSDECIFYTGLASTETGTICQFPIRKGTPINDELLPLGQAVTGMKVHLLDLNGNTVPALTAGEIVIESEYISLGYFAQPEQTAEKFFLKDGRRYYRMGDIGRYDEKGCLWHCGRGDQLIKIRGNRIELNEVESAFLAQRELIDSIVLVRKRPDGEDYLAAIMFQGLVVRSMLCRSEIELQARFLYLWFRRKSYVSINYPER